MPIYGRRGLLTTEAKNDAGNEKRGQDGKSAPDAPHTSQQDVPDGQPEQREGKGDKRPNGTGGGLKAVLKSAEMAYSVTHWSMRRQSAE